jgi:hypothetical protein
LLIRYELFCTSVYFVINVSQNVFVLDVLNNAILKNNVNRNFQRPREINKQVTVKLGYNELGCKQTFGYNKDISGHIGHFTTQINPVIANKNGWSRTVCCYNRF